MKVENLMSSRVHTCGEDVGLDVPARIMWERDVGVVPVVDEGRHLVGILTDRDIAMAAVLQGRVLRQIRVADTMTRDVATVAPGDELRTAERTMAERQVRRLPVVDGAKRVVGMLSLNDLASALAEGRAPGVPAPEIARTLQAISHHRIAVAK